MVNTIIFEVGDKRSKVRYHYTSFNQRGVIFLTRNHSKKLFDSIQVKWAKAVVSKPFIGMDNRLDPRVIRQADELRIRSKLKLLSLAGAS